MSAEDFDSGEFGVVKYTQLSGDDVIAKSLVLDPASGEIRVADSTLLDRERVESEFDMLGLVMILFHFTTRFFHRPHSHCRG